MLRPSGLLFHSISKPTFSYLHSPFIIILSIIGYLLLLRTFLPFTIPSRASVSRQFLLRQWSSQFRFLFYFVCPFYTLHPSPYPHIKCFEQFLFIPSQCPSLCTIQRYTPHRTFNILQYFTLMPVVLLYVFLESMSPEVKVIGDTCKNSISI